MDQPHERYDYDDDDDDDVVYDVLSTQCVCVFCMDLRTNSDCFPIQHESSSWVKVESPLPGLSAVKNDPTTRNYFNRHISLL